MNREECKQQIVDHALAWMEADLKSGEPPIYWTVRELDAALSDMRWNDGFIIDFDLGTVASAINARWKELHPDSRTSKEVDAEEPKPKSQKAESGKEKSHYKRAIRVRRSPETWRHLDNYPGYQISSHGRLRTVQRAKADDVLKPRFSWHYGKVVMAYELRDKDGNRKARFVGSLMMSVGFLKAPQWKKKALRSPVG